MSLKKNIIRHIEQELFSSLNARIKKISEEAYVLNEHKHFEYHFFKSGNEISFRHPLNKNSKAFLDEALNEYKDRISDKEAVMAYLIGYLNAATQAASIYELLPATVKQKLPSQWAGISDPQLEVYKKKSEYQLLLAQATLNSMGV